MSDILTILTEYSEAITSIGVLTTLFGAVIGYFIRSRKDRKSGEKNKEVMESWFKGKE